MDTRLQHWAQYEPDRVAVAGDSRWTYGELDRRVSSLAVSFLRCGAFQGRRVMLLAPPGPRRTAALLAAFRAGLVAVPVDPAWPDQRIADLMSDLDPVTCFADAGFRALLAQRSAGIAPDRWHVLDFAREGEDIPGTPAVGPDAPAYILYTSGSTGHPKGVVQSRGNLSAHMQAYVAALDIRPDDRLSGLAPWTFDAGLMDLMGAVCAGATLCPVDPAGRGLENLDTWLQGCGATVLHLTPTLLRALLSRHRRLDFPALRLVVLGGEPATEGDLGLIRSRLPPGVRVVNGYGPTECTLATQYHTFASNPLAGFTPRIPIGRPVPGVEVLLRDENGAGVEGAGTGEMVIRSPRVALGYWRRPEATAAVFGRDPSTGIPTYATGDLARRTEEGLLVHLGRLDQQVKVRGVRVEPAEVEAHLTAQPGIVAGAVGACSLAGEVRLVAWYTAETNGPTPGDLRRALSAVLPEPLLPSEIHRLPALPLLSTGKIDRKALTAEREREQREADWDCPDEISRIWAAVLGVARVHPDADFFEAGGDSLAALRAALRLEEALGRPVPSVYRYPTLRRMTTAILQFPPPVSVRPLSQVLHTDRAPLSPPQRRYWARHESGASLHLCYAVEIQGDLQEARLRRALTSVVERHHALRIQILGAEEPYQLAGAIEGITLPVEQCEWTGSKEEQRRRFLEAARLLGQPPFDPKRPGMMRQKLLRYGPDRHALLLAFHHLVMDAHSRELFEADLFGAYATAERLRTPAPRDYLASASDMDTRSRRFREWWGQLTRSERRRVQEERFGILDAATPLLRLPVDGAGTCPDDTAAVYTRKLSAQQAAALNRLAGELQCSLFALVAALFQVLLAWWTGNAQVAVTTDRANRLPQEWETLGLFADPLPIVGVVRPDVPFAAVTHQVHSRLGEAQDPEAVFFSDLVECLWPGSLHQYDTLFPAGVFLEDAEEPRVRPGGLRSRTWEVGSGMTSRDLLLVAQRERGGITMQFIWRRGRFSPATPAWLMQELIILLECVAEAPGRRCAHHWQALRAER